MIIVNAKENPEYWQRLRNHDDEEEPLIELKPWERHLPQSKEVLDQWRKELPYHGKSSYSEVIKRDINFAEKCNQLGCEIIVSFKNDNS